jgi:hypothetical protein
LVLFAVGIVSRDRKKQKLLQKKVHFGGFHSSRMGKDFPPALYFTTTPPWALLWNFYFL